MLPLLGIFLKILVWEYRVRIWGLTVDLLHGLLQGIVIVSSLGN